MKTLKWTLCGLAVVAFAFSASVALCAEAAKDAPKDAPKAKGEAKAGAKSGLRGDYGIMASELNMTDAQKAQLESVVKEQDAKLAAWKAENGEKQKELAAKLEEAKKAKDEATMKSIKEQQKTLMDAQHNLEADKAKAVEAILTPEQKEKWAVYGVYRAELNSFRKANLTEEQKAKVKELCAAASKDIAAAGEDKKAKEKVMKDLAAKIKADVLTEDQRKAMEQKPEPKAKGEGKPKGGEKAAETAPAAK